MTDTDISLFDYDLPQVRIAQYPLPVRDSSKLLVVHRRTGQTEDKIFRHLPDYLQPGDVLVFNDSRVIKARLIGMKESTGASIELFLVKRIVNKESCNRILGQELWEVLAKPAKRLKAGDRIVIGTEGADTKMIAEVIGKKEGGLVEVCFHHEDAFDAVIERLGHIPLPPYIIRQDEEVDTKRYQTVYSAAPGSVAAPTAGLHFTETLLDQLRNRGVETVYVTLHVGLGTFLPVKVSDIGLHKMHEERYHISEEAAAAINRAKAEKRRIICVGTTAVRTLESASHTIKKIYESEKLQQDRENFIRPGCGATDIFIKPGYEFRMADALITNFHLPKSTLLMLVSAFYDRKKVLEIYEEAIENGYRFFSYGDAMLLL